MLATRGAGRDAGQMGESSGKKRRCTVTAGTVGDDAALTIERQDGVIERRQAHRCGWTDNDLRRMVRRRELRVVHRGVYVNHTGPLTWRQRAWAAVLGAFPAALSHHSAILPGAGPTIHIAVDRTRSVAPRPGVVVHYRSRLDDDVLWHLGPPRIRVEQAVLDVAANAADEATVVAALTDCLTGTRTTTVDRVLAVLPARPNLRRAAFIRAVLIDIRDGTCSTLEHGYLTLVERAHGLPTAARQAATEVGRRGFRDVAYRQWGVIVELDGRRGHDRAADRDRDLERDLDAVVGAELLTLRIGFGQVFGRPCSTARKVAAVLAGRGWPGTLRSCPSCLARAAA